MLDEYSGHADQSGLVKWVTERLPIRNDIFIVHGEEGARTAMASALETAGLPRVRIRLPIMGETVRLTTKGAKTERVRARVDVAANANADWHNAYAETVLALRQGLDTAKDEKSRRTLLNRVRAALNA